ncbi:MAG: hypothetical protein MJK04_29710, partial [Psychrosphaera sp.]|nr:hypothetical protein [Psychrosphaera sp.]
YDVRRLRLDESDYGALLSDYSGIRKDSVVLSFGRQHTCGTAIDDIAVAMGNVSHRSAYVADVFWPTLDNEPIGGVLTQSARLNEWANEATPQGSPWLGYWDNRSWGESNYPLIATRSSALFTRKHDKDFVFEPPNPQLSITFTYGKAASLGNPLVDLGTTSTRNLELSANQQPGLALADSIRFNVQAIGVLPHGLTWLGHWDTRVWQTADYANIGVQNNALVTHYYESDTVWHHSKSKIGTALESVHQFYGESSTATLYVSQTSDHSIKLSETTAIGKNLAASARTDQRISDVAALNQFWQGQWDTRIWSQTNNAMIGLHHYSLFIRQHPVNLTIAEPVTGVGYFYAYSGAVTLPSTEVNTLLTKSYRVQQLPIGTLANEAATSIRLSERAINLSQQGEFWLGYWDTRIWTDSHKLTIGLAHLSDQA